MKRTLSWSALFLAGILVGALSFFSEFESLNLNLGWVKKAVGGQAAAPSDASCVQCHEGIEPIHPETVQLSCVDCHGGDGTQKEMAKAHILPRQKMFASSANPKSSYAALNFESPEFIRFMNPSDLRVAEQVCGDCHGDIVKSVRKSIMALNPLVPNAGLYNNGVHPWKIPFYGEAFTLVEKNGLKYYAPAEVVSDPPPKPEEIARGVLPRTYPLPRFEIAPPTDPFRALERGNVGASTRGPGTEFKISGAVLTVIKTRLNDPTLWLMGPNTNGGDFRQSGCAACHVPYANDGDEANSGEFAKYGNKGYSFSGDKAIPKNQPGHPIKHKFTQSIPSSQCVSCHHHQGNGALTMYQGYLWWDQETDADKIMAKGMEYPWWGKDVAGIYPPYIPKYKPDGTTVLSDVARHNKDFGQVQFSDQQGHYWHFVKVFWRDRYGRMLDKERRIVADNDPDRFSKAVHMKDIHLEKGMQCSDCHTSQDLHGDGHIYGAMRDAIEIRCQDCHGDATKRATLVTSGLNGGADLKKKVTQFGKPQFEVQGNKIIQRSKMREDLSWEVSQVVDSITPGNPRYNWKAARAMSLWKDGKSMTPAKSEDQLAHRSSQMECASCHASWNSACSGCHLSVRTNVKTKDIHLTDEQTRGYTDYNPQLLRADTFFLGISGKNQGNKVSPFRPANPVLVSVYNRNRDNVVHEQPTISGAGYSGFSYTPNPPHTIRKAEVRDCEDCHVSAANDNNAWLATVLGVGSNGTNFSGEYVFVAEKDRGIRAIRVTVGYEPRPVIGSNLHKIAFPRDYDSFAARGRELRVSASSGATSPKSISVRGEYALVADGPSGLRVYDVANVDNKSVAQKIVPGSTSPVQVAGNAVGTAFGAEMRVPSANATYVALPSTVPMDLDRKALPQNLEQPIAQLFRYAFVADSVEGLIVVDVNTLHDGNNANNYLTRAATFNPNGALKGANHIKIAGNYAYILSEETGLHVVNISNPTSPRMVARIGAPGIVRPRALNIQFRYAFVVDGEGMKVVDVTEPEKPRLAPAKVAISDARDVYPFRTYALVAAGKQGLAIINVERPERPGVPSFFNAGGQMNDVSSVIVGATYASQFAYVADGVNGLRIVRLYEPPFTPGHLGFSPKPTPELVSTFRRGGNIIAISDVAKRDRAVDESGNQIGIANRLGAHPLNGGNMSRMIKSQGRLNIVENSTPPPHRTDPLK